MLLHALEDDQLGLPQIDLIPGLMGLKQTNMIKSGLFCFILDAPTGFLVVASTSDRHKPPDFVIQFLWTPWRYKDSSGRSDLTVHVPFAAL